MALRANLAAVVALNPPLPPSAGELADVDAVAPHQPTRPGEYREPLSVALEAIPGRFAEDIGGLGVPIGTGVALAVERYLLLDDLRPRLSMAVARSRLNLAAAHASVNVRLDSASAAYVRALSAGRGAGHVEPHAIVHLSVPVRLAPRATEANIATALDDAGAVCEALSWEVAAVVDRRTMAEWALLQLLEATGFPASARASSAPRSTA